MPLEQNQMTAWETATMQPQPQTQLTTTGNTNQTQGEDEEMTNDASTAMQHIMNAMTMGK